jgi:hypothetical protein
VSICSKDLLDGVIVLLTRKEVLWQESRAKEGNLIIELLTTEIIPMTSIVINCAGDNELARKINDYLKAKITQSDDTIYISLSEDELEIDLEKLRISKANVRKLLKDFIKSNPDLADYYSIMEFEDMFVVGIPKSIDEMTVNCEMCGYIASSEEDLNIHKRTHGLIFILYWSLPLLEQLKSLPGILRLSQMGMLHHNK